MKQKLESVQQILQEQKLDGWLLYDFRRSNSLACCFLEIPETQLLTRRFFYWIPNVGEPVKIVHSIENPLKELPGKVLKFSSWQQMEEHLKAALKGRKNVAMEYSPRNAIPYISKVDAGTVEMIRGFDVEVISSCDILQKCMGVLTLQQGETHLAAAKILDQTAEKAWQMIAEALNQDQVINEYDVQQFILNEFKTHNCMTDDPPICAVNAHTADPHYCPSKTQAQTIKKGDFILIDLWCKLKQKDAIYADITRVAVTGRQPTSHEQDIFNLVREAQKVATQLVQERFKKNRPLAGWEIDQAAREIISKAGYGDYFVHRTGHSIDTSDHGSGTNIDNFETQDQRFIIPGTCFSIEPGIYLPHQFGIRLEYDIYVELSNKVTVTGGIQDSIRVLSV